MNRRIPRGLFVTGTGTRRRQNPDRRRLGAPARRAGANRAPQKAGGIRLYVRRRTSRGRGRPDAPSRILHR